jgi:hypothetical protein
MKKFTWLLILIVIVMFSGMSYAEEDFPPPRDGEGVIGNARTSAAWRLGMFEALEMNGIEYAWPAADGTATYQLTTDGSGTLTWAANAGGSTVAYDDIASPDANASIDFVTFTNTWDSQATAGDIFNIQATGNFGDISVVRIESKTGNPTNGTILEVVSHDANVDPLVVVDSTAVSVLVVGQAGTVAVTTVPAAADQFKVDATGTVAGDAINLETTDGGIMLNADGATEGDIELNAAGSIIITAAEAVATGVTILAPAGGIDITTAATFDIDLTATGGRILGVASEAVADQFKIDAQGTVAGDAINLETSDGGIMLNADGASNGDIELNAADDIILTAAGLITVGPGLVLPAEVVAATNVLTAAECGLISFLNHATEFDSQLPAISTAPAGCTFEFYVTAAADTGSYTVTTGNTQEAIINGIINDNNTLTACAAEDTITFVTGNNVGDHAKVVSDGTSWIISGEGLAGSKLTCTDEA